MLPIPCKQCVCFAICNSRLNGITRPNEIIRIANMLVEKCPIVKNYLKEHCRISYKSKHKYENIITFSIRPFINTFLDELITSKLTNSSLRITIIHDNNTIRYGTSYQALTD